MGEQYKKAKFSRLLRQQYQNHGERLSSILINNGESHGNLEMVYVYFITLSLSIFKKLTHTLNKRINQLRDRKDISKRLLV